MTAEAKPRFVFRLTDRETKAIVTLEADSLGKIEAILVTLRRSIERDVEINRDPISNGAA